MKELETKIIKSPQSIEDAKSIRIAVFQMEQGIAQEVDFDGEDDKTTHIVVYDGQTPLGTGRIRSLPEEGRFKIERIAVLESARGLGVGREIMNGIHAHLQEIGAIEATLDSQSHASGFYEKLGYVQVGKEFQEAGIPHVVMTKLFKKER